ncbi:serine--tRNA ligase, mitochondrial [Procambarus clarkii]|uniref:serine--tRNA ligase, mitochondrial n=1 Tax=Procambarus clarkii TaxID=6728 RepID=UPI001E67420A|nr:serine--tRNA ligase, mitochondrial-like [Procambarus clarkii]XP_045585002.1 serine--tRNA ligase, mitochondrial-like [Procambarus clarkii]XP_045585003.1 serine--tRNA ligase, mitochondrial-like [Procambarus clarkii]
MKQAIINYIQCPFKCRKYITGKASDYFRSFCSLQNFGNANEKTKPKLDYKYLCNPENAYNIDKLIKKRKNVGNIWKLLEINKKLNGLSSSSQEYEALQTELEREALNIPNNASPHLWEYGEEPKILEFVNPKPKFNFEPLEFSELGQKLDIIRTENLGNLMASRSYYLKGPLSVLEQALIRYTVSYLLRKGFTLMSVPDLLYSDIIDSCGMNTKGEMSQVYHIINPNEGVCLSGTAEMSLGGYLRNKTFTLQELPMKLAAVSRCYRAEAASSLEKKGIYRVHEFTKVEMFGVTAVEAGEESHQLYTEMTRIQKKLFSQLGFHFQILDMPLNDLGAPAYTKTDMEAWMPGRGMYGEISSASNCTDYQARRLNITYRNNEGIQRLAHTVNGTACAIPRTIIAVCETFQSHDGTITIPAVLQPYMSGIVKINPPSSPSRISSFKQKTYPGKIKQ